MGTTVMTPGYRFAHSTRHSRIPRHTNNRGFGWMVHGHGGGGGYADHAAVDATSSTTTPQQQVQGFHVHARREFELLS